LVRLERRQDRIDGGIPAVADGIDRLAESGNEIAAEVALPVQARDVLVQLPLLVAVPGVFRREALENEEMAELTSEVLALVRGRRLVVPVRRVALRRVHGLGHRHDLRHLEGVASRGNDAPRELEGEAARRVARDAACLLEARATHDGDDELAPLLRRI